jgi:glycerate 2-kinase
VTRASRRALTALFEAALARLEPSLLVDDLLAREQLALAPLLEHARRAGLLVVGAGKGAARIAAALETALASLVTGGLVIVPPGYACRTRRVRVRLARHPLPDRRGVAATRALLMLVARRRRAAILVVVSGGASSLLVLPAPGLTLDDKRRAHALLLASGASIAEMNCVRAHLSAVKGGRLAVRLVGRPAVALVLSDVPGDDVAVVGSGPTVPDRTTFADALGVVRRYGVEERLPARVRRHLGRGAAATVRERGADGRVQDDAGRRTRDHTGRESRPPADAATIAHVPTLLLAGNGTACAAAARAARDRGFAPVVRLRRPLSGSTSQAARRLAARLRALRAAARGSLPAVLVAGGETTVRLGPRDTGGRGGRNQELALEVARLLGGERGWLLLCAGTDGIDGPTDAAGAIVDGDTIARAARAGRSVDEALARHDVYPLLAAIGALYRPGPTGTNVADLVIGLVWRDRGWRVPMTV